MAIFRWEAILRILLCCGDQVNAVQWYRGYTPWSYLAGCNSTQRVELVYFSGHIPSNSDIRAIDLVFLLRPGVKALEPVIERAKENKVPIWVDWDDDVFSIPADNPNSRWAHNPETLRSIRSFISSADLVTASTEHLKTQLLALNPNVEVLKNAFHPALTRFMSLGAIQNKIVFWRGSPTHDRDVHSVAQALVQVANENPDFQFVFAGHDPVSYACSEKIKNVVRLPHMDLMTYFEMICLMRPKVFISPLADNLFNRSKSNIGAIEALTAGAVCIAPNWEQWKMPGVFNYDSEEAFHGVLTAVLLTSENVSAANVGFEYVHANLHLGVVTLKRFDLAKKIIEEKK